MKNKRGFTLIELLAVIVILAILITTAIPAVSRYLDSSRKDTYVIDVSQAVNTIRTKALQEGVSSEKVYTLTDINTLLDKKLVKSPYGKNYDDTSYIKVVIENNKPKYKVCIVDNEGNGLYNSYNIEKSLFVTGNPNDDYCHAEDDLTAPTCTWSGPYSDSSLTTSLGTGTQSTTVYYGLECTDDVAITDGLEVNELENTNFSNVTIANTTEQTNGYKYTISAKTSNNIGNANIVLTTNAIKDRSNKGNESKTSANVSLNKIYLYNAGNEYSTLTGGWGAYKSQCNGTAVASKGTTSLNYRYSGGNSCGRMKFITSSAIDLTSYNTISFTIPNSYTITLPDTNVSQWGVEAIGIGASATRITTTDWHDWANIAAKEYKVHQTYYWATSLSVPAQTITVNVSSLTGRYYVLIFIEVYDMTMGSNQPITTIYAQ